LGGVYYHQDHLQQARDFVMKSLAIREEIGDILGVARSYNNLGNLCWKLGSWDEAINNFKHSAELQTRLGDAEGTISLNNNLGVLQIDRGYIDEARKYLEEALNQAENIGHNLNIALTNYHISLTFSALGEWQAALGYNSRAEALLKNIGEKENLVDVYVNMGVIYMGLHDLSKAADYAEQALALFIEFAAESETEVKGCVLRLLGDVDLALHNTDRASERYREAERILDAVGNRLEQGRLLVSMAKLAAAQSNQVLAAARMASAWELFEQLGARLDLLKLETLKKDLAL
jgi:tetratricopeptide (TPR) repeat protein